MIYVIVYISVMMDPAGFEPAAFALRTQRSTPDLQAPQKLKSLRYKNLHPAKLFNRYVLDALNLAKGLFNFLGPTFKIANFHNHHKGF